MDSILVFAKTHDNDDANDTNDIRASSNGHFDDSMCALRFATSAAFECEWICSSVEGMTNAANVHMYKHCTPNTHTHACVVHRPAALTVYLHTHHTHKHMHAVQMAIILVELQMLLMPHGYGAAGVARRQQQHRRWPELGCALVSCVCK